MQGECSGITRNAPRALPGSWFLEGPPPTSGFYFACYIGLGKAREKSHN